MYKTYIVIESRIINHIYGVEGEDLQPSDAVDRVKQNDNVVLIDEIQQKRSHMVIPAAITGEQNG